MFVVHGKLCLLILYWEDVRCSSLKVTLPLKQTNISRSPTSSEHPGFRNCPFVTLFIFYSYVYNTFCTAHKKKKIFFFVSKLKGLVQHQILIFGHVTELTSWYPQFVRWFKSIGLQRLSIRMVRIALLSDKWDENCDWKFFLLWTLFEGTNHLWEVLMTVKNHKFILKKHHYQNHSQGGASKEVRYNCITPTHYVAKKHMGYASRWVHYS